MEDIAIKVEHVSKSFKLPHEKSGSIKNVLINFARRQKGYEIQQVLHDASFEIKKGEFFGIVGRNGSGKSTLLKILAGIYTPTTGSIQVNGKLTPFIELGVGFNPELTGRENVFLNGALLGFSRKDMAAMYDDIVEFAELEKFMDQKLKNYSSGMQVRLAFSIAIRAQSDILVLDEVLAVGDEAFQRKCNDYFAAIKKTGQTVVLVTHDMTSIRKYCTRAILLSEGKIVLSESPDNVANEYTFLNLETGVAKVHGGKFPTGLNALVPALEIVPISKRVLTSSDTFEFTINYQITKDIPVRFGISLIDERSGSATSVFDDQIKDDKGELVATSVQKGKYSFRYKVPLHRFNDRDFTITATLYEIVGDKAEVIAYTAEERVGRFVVRGGEPDGGLLKEKGRWIT
jgi:ABC-2 type transport system ATP-binding protein